MRLYEGEVNGQKLLDNRTIVSNGIGLILNERNIHDKINIELKGTGISVKHIGLLFGIDK